MGGKLSPGSGSRRVRLWSRGWRRAVVARSRRNIARRLGGCWNCLTGSRLRCARISRIAWVAGVSWIALGRYPLRQRYRRRINRRNACNRWQHRLRSCRLSRRLGTKRGRRLKTGRPGVGLRHSRGISRQRGNRSRRLRCQRLRGSGLRGSGLRRSGLRRSGLRGRSRCLSRWHRPRPHGMRSLLCGMRTLLWGIRSQRRCRNGSLNLVPARWTWTHHARQACRDGQLDGAGRAGE